MTAPSKALVGPLRKVWFRDDGPYGYDLPTSTLDPRWKACTTHRTACDCREAELAEHIDALRKELRNAESAADRILSGHPTWAYGPDFEPAWCECTGCQLARAAHLRLWSMP